MVRVAFHNVKFVFPLRKVVRGYAYLFYGVFGVNVGHLWDEHEMIRDWMRQILEWLLTPRLKV